MNRGSTRSATSASCFKLLIPLGYQLITTTNPSLPLEFSLEFSMCLRGLGESLKLMGTVPPDVLTPPQAPGRTVHSAPSHEHSPQQHQLPANSSPSSSRRSSSSAAQSALYSLETSSRSTCSTPKTSIASSSSSLAVTGFFSDREVRDSLAMLEGMYARGEIRGTYDLGNGRRGAISGPSSDYREGDYDEVSGEESVWEGRGMRKDEVR